MNADTFITHETLTQAWANWLQHHHGLQCEEVEERFFTYCHSLEQSFIDDPLDWENDNDQYHVAADTAHRINLLAGPHFNTVISAYYAKHPWGQP